MTDLITILRCFLSFKIVVKSQFVIVFKIILPRPKDGCRVTHALMGLVVRPARDPIHLNCAEIYQPILHFVDLSLLDNMVCIMIAVYLDVSVV